MNFAILNFVVPLNARRLRNIVYLRGDSVAFFRTIRHLSCPQLYGDLWAFQRYRGGHKEVARVFVSAKTHVVNEWTVYAVVSTRRWMEAFVCRSLRALANAIDKAPGIIVRLVNVIVNDERRGCTQFTILLAPYLLLRAIVRARHSAEISRFRVALTLRSIL